MQQEITYEFSPSLVKPAMRQFIWRRAGRSLVAFCVIASLGVLGIVFHLPPGFPWLSAVALGFSLAYGYIWWGYYQNATQACDTMPDSRVTVKLDLDTITFQTSEHTSTLKWSRVKTAWQFPEVLLLFTYTIQSGFSILPVEALGAELQQYIEDRIREHGGEVV